MSAKYGIEMTEKQTVAAAIVVAHPDDEIIWAGGTALMHPDWQWTVISLCRGNDRDRAPRFFWAVQQLGGTGKMGDLDDGPEQAPLPRAEVEQVVISLLPAEHFDLILTHSPYGEYTRHLRHEEASQAVTALWGNGLIKTDELWLFAYKDNGRQSDDDLPRAIKTAHRMIELPESIWQTKYRIITDIYGFSADSYEVRITQKEEAFWRFRSPAEFKKWLRCKRSER